MLTSGDRVMVSAPGAPWLGLVIEPADFGGCVLVQRLEGEQADVVYRLHESRCQRLDSTGRPSAGQIPGTGQIGTNLSSAESRGVRGVRIRGECGGCG